MSVMTPKSPSGGNGPDVRSVQDDAGETVYYEPLQGSDIGIVVRTCADGDNPLRTTRIKVYSDEKSVSPRSKKKENDDAAKAVLAAYGYKGAFTPMARQFALELIEYEKACKS